MRRILVLLVRAGDVTGAIAIAAIAVLVTYEVFARFAGSPTLWTMEVTSYLMIGAAVLAAGGVLLDDGHFRVRMLVDMLPAPVVRVLDAVNAVLTTAFVLAITFGAFAFLGQAISFGFRSPTLLKIPLYWPYSVLVAGLVLLSLACLLVLGRRGKSP